MAEEEKELESFPSNSHNEIIPQEEPKKIINKGVTTGKRIVKQKSWADTFLNGTLKVVGAYILFDILIPAAKNTVFDIIKNGADMMLFGEGSRDRRHSRDGTIGTRVSYERYYDRDRDRARYDDRRDSRDYNRSSFHSDDVLLPSREAANDVLDAMQDILDKYNAISVSDFLELVNLPDEYTDRGFGWTNLSRAEVQRVRDGYIIDLPSPRALPR